MKLIELSAEAAPTLAIFILFRERRKKEAKGPRRFWLDLENPAGMFT
jgi:hypothetical protein